MRSVKKFFNKIQVTCVGAHVGEFVINGSDHALIKCNREQGSAFQLEVIDGKLLFRPPGLDVVGNQNL
jgi:hypothetical protein